jgi:hypothetical protein
LERGANQAEISKDMTSMGSIKINDRIKVVQKQARESVANLNNDPGTARLGIANSVMDDSDQKQDPKYRSFDRRANFANKQGDSTAKRNSKSHPKFRLSTQGGFAGTLRSERESIEGPQSAFKVFKQGKKENNSELGIIQDDKKAFILIKN